MIAIFGDHIEKLLSRIEFQTADIDAEDPFRDELLEEVGATLKAPDGMEGVVRGVQLDPAGVLGDGQAGAPQLRAVFLGGLPYLNKGRYSLRALTMVRRLGYGPFPSAPQEKAPKDEMSMDQRLPLESRGVLAPSTPVNPRMARTIRCGPR